MVVIIQTLQFTLQKRIVNVVLNVAAVHGPLTSHVSMTKRKLMMEKATDSRLVVLHGLCAVVRKGVAQGAATHMADTVAALKFAFDMGYNVRPGYLRTGKRQGQGQRDGSSELRGEMVRQ